jgi:Glycosyl hydrolase family 1
VNWKGGCWLCLVGLSSTDASRLHRRASSARMNRSRRTPVPFWWGISSSAFQTEDRGEHPDSPNYFRTDWDLFADAKRVPPKGDTAEFSWSNFDRDLDALKKIGVSHYRFSVEWARVEPQPGDTTRQPSAATSTWRENSRPRGVSRGGRNHPQESQGCLGVEHHGATVLVWGLWDPTRAYFNFMQRLNLTYLDRTHDVCDLIGFNYYYSEYADFTALVALKARRGRNYSLLGWVIQPRSLYKQVQTLSRRYGRPIVITENGIATSKNVKRVRYLFNHMLEVKEAIDDGYDVRGYFGQLRVAPRLQGAVWLVADGSSYQAAHAPPLRAFLQRHHRDIKGSLDAPRGFHPARTSPRFHRALSRDPIAAPGARGERDAVARFLYGDPHWHEDVEKWRADLDYAGAHFVNQLEVDLIVGEVSQRIHEELRVEGDGKVAAPVNDRQ